MHTGPDIIAAFVKTLPEKPGVYRMFSAGGEVLYVGKAKSLKKRVTAYTQLDKHPIRLQRMILQTAHMEFTLTHTETEALLLEANLIRKLKPRYNILLRDDKSFPYILITGDHPFPQVLKHRGAKSRKGEYFGPFASGLAVNEAIATLYKAFLLRNCPDTVFATRTRPCLQYQIKRCTAPCVGKVSQADYAKQVEMARRFLSGKSREIQEAFQEDMLKASDATDYETAALLRDRIKALTLIQAHRVQGLGDADVHVILQKNGESCVESFFFRAGQNYGNRAHFPRHDADETPEAILSAFLAQFYAERPAPRELLVNLDLPDRALLEAALKAKIARPARGGKQDIILMALRNAEDALDRKRQTDATQSQLLDALTEIFKLPARPERIEVYDNSHTGGTHALGAMIVAGPEGFRKSAYRKFNMDAQVARGGDDFGMMRAMLERRFKNTGSSPAAREGAEENLPDLLLIDGGQGQLNAVMEVLAGLGMTQIPLIAIAKGPDRNAGRERFFLYGRDEPITLPPNSPVLHFLQRLRDEAHRFAITSHRGRRSKAIVTNPLDEISGIGAKRKKALLLHFGSAKAVAEAGIADLQKVDNISTAVAQKIYDFFHGGD